MASLLGRLQSALRAGKNFSKELKSDRRLSSSDAADLCTFLGQQSEIAPLIKTEPWGEYHVPLYYLVMPFQNAEEEEVREHLRAHGLPELARLCDLALAQAKVPSHPLTMIAKMFALYAYEPGVTRVAAIARRFPEDYMLSVSFQVFGDERH